jgi:ribA/ribD-fused uncharacterized protein
MKKPPRVYLQQAVAEYATNGPTNFIYFWEHDALSHKGKNEGCCSQWCFSPFSIGDITYSCSEQYMMTEKALLFEDYVAYSAIMNAEHPGEMKAIGKRVANFEESIWKKERMGIVTTANVEKFGQNERLRQWLLDTGNKILVEASPYDKIWGIGYHTLDAPEIKPEDWAGQNLLGWAIMEARKQLQWENLQI